MKLPQLTLRELFLLVALAAMGCGWWVERQSLAVEKGKNEKLTRLLPWRDVELVSFFEEYLRGEGYKVEWDGDERSGMVYVTDPSGTSSSGTGFASASGPGPSSPD